MKKFMMLMTSALALGSVCVSGLLALSGGSLNLVSGSMNSGGGNMSGGGMNMSFSMNSAPSGALSGNGFSLQAGVLSAVRSAQANLDYSHAFPTPFKPSLGHDRITFSGLTVQSTINVYTLGGSRIVTLQKSDATDRLTWFPVTGPSGASLASGIYLFVITGPGMKPKRGKLMIVK